MMLRRWWFVTMAMPEKIAKLRAAICYWWFFSVCQKYDWHPYRQSGTSIAKSVNHFVITMIAGR